jgi:hypothetical protein
MTTEQLIIWGLLGGAFDELLHWGSLRRSRALPTYRKQWTYWFITALLVGAGGLVALAAGLSSSLASTPLAAMVVGFSAPALIKKLSKALLREEPHAGSNSESAPSIRSFLQD